MSATTSIFTNLTPHPIVIGTNHAGEFQAQRTIPASGSSARIAQAVIESGSIEISHGEQKCTVGLKTIALGEILGLPSPVEGTYYIVSMAVAKRAHELGLGRQDLLGPYSEKAIYVDGRIAGVPGLVKYDFSHLPRKEDSISARITPLCCQAVNLSFQPMSFDKADEAGHIETALTIPKTAPSATIETVAEECGTVEDVPLFSLTPRGIKNLPPKRDDTVFLVTMPVAQDAGREDVYGGDFDTVRRVDGTATSNFRGIVRYVSAEPR